MVRIAIVFDVEVEDDGAYPRDEDVKRKLYDAIEAPGYMLRGLRPVQINARIEGAARV